MSDEYTCAVCGQTFTKGWTEDEALAEKSEFFGDIPIEECEIVCDPCWKKMGFGQ